MYFWTWLKHQWYFYSQPLKTEADIPDPDTDENLGPIEPPFPSVSFTRNYTISLLTGYELWNVWGDPFNLYPNLPNNPILPTEAKFSGSQLGFRPINSGSGGSGKEFSESLGGNLPREQFTIVMLTYEREQVSTLRCFDCDSVCVLSRIVSKVIDVKVF